MRRSGMELAALHLASRPPSFLRGAGGWDASMSSVLSPSSPHFSATVVGDYPAAPASHRGRRHPQTHLPIGARKKWAPDRSLQHDRRSRARRVGARALPRRCAHPALQPQGRTGCVSCAGSHAVPRGRRAGRALRHHPWRGRDVQESWGPAASRSTHTRVSAAIGMFSFISLISCLYFARWLIHFAYFLLVCCQYVADSLASFLQFSI